jgi:hypothetical protein
VRYERQWLIVACVALVVAALWVVTQAFPPVVIGVVTSGPVSLQGVYRYNLWTGRSVLCSEGEVLPADGR